MDRRTFSLGVGVAILDSAVAKVVAQENDLWAIKRIDLGCDPEWRRTQIVSVYALGNGDRGPSNEDKDFWSNDVGTLIPDFPGARSATINPIEFDAQNESFFFVLKLQLSNTDSDQVAAFFRFMRPHKHGAGRNGVFAAAFHFPDTN